MGKAPMSVNVVIGINSKHQHRDGMNFTVRDDMETVAHSINMADATVLDLPVLESYGYKVTISRTGLTPREQCSCIDSDAAEVLETLNVNINDICCD